MREWYWLKKRTSLEFALYRLERAKEECDTAKLLYYVKTEIFPRKIGRRIVLASKVREDSDYDEEYEPSSETTMMQIETAQELSVLVQEYLNKINNR